MFVFCEYKNKSFPITTSFVNVAIPAVNVAIPALLILNLSVPFVSTVNVSFSGKPKRVFKSPICLM